MMSKNNQLTGRLHSGQVARLSVISDCKQPRLTIKFSSGDVGVFVSAPSSSATSSTGSSLSSSLELSIGLKRLSFRSDATLDRPMTPLDVEGTASVEVDG
eukprot:TRINITY_DN23849_c3_g2_i3.p1 TRINITY_DN23849_c3_g2~~TRINITY_DN23849_c3_g2_i3.p1  ORF type:complete len:100 (+),score=12.40 TRINITY_DN23849_c3_g2_i3:330-629(+)